MKTVQFTSALISSTKSAINANYKQHIGSLSQLLKYAHNDGQQDVTEFMAMVNEAKGTNIELIELNMALILKHLRGVNAKGEKRERFNFHSDILTTITKEANLRKKQAIELAKTNKALLNKRYKKA